MSSKVVNAPLPPLPLIGSFVFVPDLSFIEF